MMSRRPPRDGDSSQPAALPHACHALGVELAEARRARELSVEDVAARLMLSKRQVLGLEQADPSAFYSHVYFLKGLRKYLAFAGIPDDRLLEAPPEPALTPVAEDEDGPRLFLAEAPARAVERVPNETARHRPRLTVAAALVVSLAAAGGYAWRQSQLGASVPADGNDTVVLQTQTPLPAQPLLMPVHPPVPVEAVPAMATAVAAVSGDGGSTVQLTVGKATWVFIRLPDNRVVERRLEAGEALEVGPLPVYLAVGTADSVELRVEDRPVALEPFIRNGQVRITRPELAKLVP